jgi:hypothetical protein
MRHFGIPRLILVLVSATAALGPAALAAGSPADASVPLDALTLLLTTTSDDSADDIDAAGVRPTYGDQGSRRWSIGGMVATDFQNERIFALRGGLEWFPIDAFSLGLDADLGWVGQDAGDDAGFLGVSAMLRWHFLRNESWTLYADLGIGLFYATSPVPPDGSRLDFTPQAGVGCSIAMGEQTRLLLGIGWYHLSNARTTDTNFGIDALAVTARISLPF